MNHKVKKGTCQICRKELALSQLVPAQLLRPALVETIMRKHPDWQSAGYICRGDLNEVRGWHIQEVFQQEFGKISDLQASVLSSLKEHELLSDQSLLLDTEDLSFAQRLSDKLARFGGSWGFLISFAFFLGVWISYNVFTVIAEQFDPYPFILLNLVLSCMAAVQAPIIMMSQNRQEEKDRKRAENDYRVNLKAELEIRHLHEKVDHLLQSQWQHTLDMQQTQMELLDVISSKKR